ncbi:hypothetical protein [Catenulispora pinisilvae]|uniref:hypothetical protein n=1 Tax=Catenulispora pinisilvae TaxID=2705253 RepID=UPI001891132A|nr:hypothetical protein [Catenulispora pinisilvae]
MIAANNSSASTSAPSSAASSSPGTAATSAPSSPATSAQPNFKFPADYTLTVDPDTTGDPVKDAVLTDDARFLKAYEEALASGNANDPLLLTYATPSALALYWQKGVTTTHADGFTITGAERFYNRIVDIKSPTEADVTVCDDQSHAYNKEIATGKVHVTPATDNSYLLYYLKTQKASNGIWQVAATVVHHNDQAVKQACR